MKGTQFVSDSLLERALDNALEGFQLIGSDWRYLYVNATVASQGKRKKEELIGKTMMECYPGIEKTPLFVQMERCMRDKITVKMENEFTFPDGSNGWFQLFIQPWEEGLLIFSVDITDRKKAESRFQEKVAEVQRWFDMTLERELKMVQLKEIVTKLQKQVPFEEEIVEISH